MNYKLIKMRTEHIPYYLEQGFKNIPCVLYGELDRPFVWVCDENQCDLEYIINNNIAYKKFDNANGSSIVSSKGDIVLGFFGNAEFCKEMMDRTTLLFSNIIGANLCNNDFVYNGNKYGAITSICIGNLYYIGIQISNSIDYELIEKICKKKIEKIPTKLPQKITEKHIIDIFKDHEVFYEYNYEE